MKAGSGTDEAKLAAGEAAAATVEDGMVVGLGTGSTTAYAIRALGEAVADGLSIRGVVTSVATERLAREVGIPLTTLAAVDGIDVAIDGADQVAFGESVDDNDQPSGESADDDEPIDPLSGPCTLIKGGGGAHVREKLVAGAASRFLVVVDETKVTDVLDWPVPVAVLQGAETPVAGAIRDAGGEATLREAAEKDGPVVTDDGHFVLDCEFGPIESPETLADRLSTIPGVVDHGLFVGMADAVYVGTEADVEVYDCERDAGGTR